jgi:hypothetical protein
MASRRHPCALLDLPRARQRPGLSRILSGPSSGAWGWVGTVAIGNGWRTQGAGRGHRRTTRISKEYHNFSSWLRDRHAWSPSSPGFTTRCIDTDEPETLRGEGTTADHSQPAVWRSSRSRGSFWDLLVPLEDGGYGIEMPGGESFPDLLTLGRVGGFPGRAFGRDAAGRSRSDQRNGPGGVRPPRSAAAGDGPSRDEQVPPPLSNEIAVLEQVTLDRSHRFSFFRKSYRTGSHPAIQFPESRVGLLMFEHAGYRPRR